MIQIVINIHDTNSDFFFREAKQHTSVAKPNKYFLCLMNARDTPS